MPDGMLIRTLHKPMSPSRVLPKTNAELKAIWKLMLQGKVYCCGYDDFRIAISA